jgi:hypothetical protein
MTVARMSEARNAGQSSRVERIPDFASAPSGLPANVFARIQLPYPKDHTP